MIFENRLRGQDDKKRGAGAILCLGEFQMKLRENL